MPDGAPNRLLAAVSPEDRDRLTDAARLISFRRGTRLYGDDLTIDAVYFPLRAIVSLLAGTGEQAIEMATIGNEGAAGVFGLFCDGRAVCENVIQVAGDAIRIDVETFRSRIAERPAIERLIRRHNHALIRQILQSGVCNRLHSIDERCARWLLLTHDRAGQRSFELTQEYLASMLGVRRATVNAALGSFRKSGAIDYVRGRVAILNRAGLTHAACKCYELIRREYANVGLSEAEGSGSPAP